MPSKQERRKTTLSHCMGEAMFGAEQDEYAMLLTRFEMRQNLAADRSSNAAAHTERVDDFSTRSW